jgi:hypothetical protein
MVLPQVTPTGGPGLGPVTTGVVPGITFGPAKEDFVTARNKENSNKIIKTIFFTKIIILCIGVRV